MTKRVLLFIATNLVIVLTLSIVLSVLGVGRYISPDGRLQLVPLMVFCLAWGMGGAFISLGISRWIAKRATGAIVIDGRTGDPALDWVYATVSRLPIPLPRGGRAREGV